MKGEFKMKKIIIAVVVICLGLSLTYAEKINIDFDNEYTGNKSFTEIINAKSEDELFLSLSNPKIENVQKSSEIIEWNATWSDIYGDGVINVEFLGHKLALKAAFLRGEFDSYTQTYKTVPAVITIDDKGNDMYTVGVPVLIDKEKKFTFGNNETKISIKVKFHGNDIEIVKTDDLNQKILISYQDIFNEWLEFAEKYKYSILDKIYFFVPQKIWFDDSFRNGFVISTNNPLYYTTGLPQDFVELYKTAEFPADYEYKPVGYSLATKLAFVLSDTQEDIWQIREMTAEEIGEEMLNETQRQKKTLTDSFFSNMVEIKKEEHERKN